MDFFSGDYISALGGAAPSNFYMYYRFTKACYRTPKVGWGPPPKKIIVKIIFGPHIQLVRSNNFRYGSILTELYSADVPRGRGDKMGTIFTMPAPKIRDGQKNRPNFFRDF